MALADLLLRGAGALGQRLAATQQPQAPTTPAAASPLQRAFTNALVNPNMPIEAGFRTDSAKVNADLERQARIRNQLLAGRSAIIERARAQGRQVDVDEATGQLIIGDPPASSPVRTIGGQRFAFDAQGRPVGMAGGAISPPRLEGQTTPTVLTPEQAMANRQRINAALTEAIRRDSAPAAPVAPAVAAAAAPVAAPVAAPAVTAPVVDIPSRLTATRVPPAVEPQITPEEELAQAQQFLQEEPARVAEEQAQARSKTYEQQVAETTRELARARVQRDQGAVRRLTARLTQLMAGRPGTTASEQAVQERLGREAVRRAMPPLGF